MQNLIFIKLGGAVITNKEVPNQLRPEILARLAKEITRAKTDNPELQLLIGNGVGSFAHVPAARYKTMEGFIHEESKMGMAITQDSAAQSNRAVVAALIAAGLPAVTVAPSGFVITNKRVAQVSFLNVLVHYLSQGLQPVTHGDVIADVEQGCTIWSTDKVFGFLARELSKKEYKISEIIHVTEADGVWKNPAKDIYERITPELLPEVKQAMVDTKGFDVTGGMLHKIEESLALTTLGIQTRIMSGLFPDHLYQQLAGQANYGTVITAE